MIQEKDFDKYCKKGEDFIRIQDSSYPHGDLCFVLNDEGYAQLYNCNDGYYFGVPIRSLTQMKRVYELMTNKELEKK